MRIFEITDENKMLLMSLETTEEYLLQEISIIPFYVGYILLIKDNVTTNNAIARLTKTIDLLSNFLTSGLLDKTDSDLPKFQNGLEMIQIKLKELENLL